MSTVPEIDASRGKIIKSSPIGHLNRSFGNTDSRFLYTVNQVNFAGNLISQISRKVKICEIKLPQNFTLTSMISFQFSRNQVATKLAIISNSRKKLAAKLTCFTVLEFTNRFIAGVSLFMQSVLDSTIESNSSYCVQTKNCDNSFIIVLKKMTTLL